MKRFILILISLTTLSQSDINYDGSCGYYDFNISVATANYSSAFCSDDILLVKYSGDNYIRKVVPDIEALKIYTVQADTMKMYHEFDVTENQIISIGSEEFRKNMALAGLLSGFLVVQMLLGSM